MLPKKEKSNNQLIEFGIIKWKIKFIFLMPYCCEENGRGGQKLFCYTMLFNFWVVSRS